MPSLAFLFWNLNRKPLEHRVARIVQAHSVDVVILAECETDPAQVVSALSATGTGTFQAVPDSGERLQLFDKTGASWRLLVKDQLDAWIGFTVTVPGQPDLLFFVAHMPSKLRADPHDQLNDATELAADIRASETRVGNDRTVLVGDLNVNPFDPAVTWVRALHGVPTRDVARREAREVRSREYPMFYNPMWGFFGDRYPEPPGTYYRSSSSTVNYFWNTYDQVLLRPGMMDRLADIQILASDGSESLITQQGLPDKASGSDHLPLYFRLDW